MPHLIRVGLGLLLLAASLPKIADPAAFLRSVAGYRLLPGASIELIAWFLPWLELCVGAVLVFAPSRLRGGAWLLTAALYLSRF